ncbi:MAG: hypothetical protein PF448_04325 [Bacteroidales bacterium]|nr:hypothetical protein [Bacteroidales bacterium]
MKLKSLFAYLIAFSFAAFLFSACEKDDDDDDNQDNTQITNEQALQVISDYAIAQNMFAEATDEADNAARVSDDSLENNKGGKAVRDGSYPEISITPFDLETWPKTIRVDYGPINMMCEDGRNRRGIINIVATDFYRNSGSELTTTFEDFYQNNYKVEGTRICTNNGENTAGNLTYGLIVNDGHITTPESKHIYYEENTVREWVAGEETLLNPWDDNYLITGDQTGVSSDSIDYQLNIHTTSPLDVLVACKWVRAGLLDLDIEDFPTITINYGDGTCDNQATATIYDVEYPIVLE